MKSIFRILLFAMAMTTFCTSTYAQKDSRQRMTREQLAETQAKYIAQKMEMDDTTAEKFVATFCQFQKEIWARYRASVCLCGLNQNLYSYG